MGRGRSLSGEIGGDRVEAPRRWDRTRGTFAALGRLPKGRGVSSVKLKGERPREKPWVRKEPTQHASGPGAQIKQADIDNIEEGQGSLNSRPSEGGRGVAGGVPVNTGVQATGDRGLAGRPLTLGAQPTRRPESRASSGWTSRSEGGEQDAPPARGNDYSSPQREGGGRL